MMYSENYLLLKLSTPTASRINKMKHLLLLLSICTAPSISYAAAGQAYEISDDKAYKVEYIDGMLLTSNEYTPLNEDGFTDDYFTSKKYHEARHANNLLFGIRTDRVQPKFRDKKF